jgi:hypothetical protein
VVDVSIRHTEPDDAEAIHRILSSPLAAAFVVTPVPRHPQPLARLKFFQVSQNSSRYISYFDVSKTSHEPLMPISLA